MRTDMAISTMADSIASGLDELLGHVVGLSDEERRSILPRLERVSADLDALVGDVRRQVRESEAQREPALAAVGE